MVSKRFKLMQLDKILEYLLNEIDILSIETKLDRYPFELLHDGVVKVRKWIKESIEK